MKNYLKLYKP